LYGKYIFAADLQQEAKESPENLDQTPSHNIAGKREGN